MRFKDRVYNDVGVVTLKGNLMGKPETDKLLDEVKAMLGSDIKKVILDLHGVKWLNSIGVSAIIKSYSVVNNANGTFGLANISGKINSLLVMTQLKNIFKVYIDVDTALNDLKN
jgi:anti-sigma B factor antagonist